MIIDAPIFAGYPDRNFETYVYNRVGTPSQEYGIGRTGNRFACFDPYGPEKVEEDADFRHSVCAFVCSLFWRLKKRKSCGSGGLGGFCGE